MFLQDTPPDTVGYMIAGYIVFFVMAAIYLISLIVRSRNLRQDLNLLETMQKEGRAAATPPSRKSGPAKPKAGGQ